jgi:hypothetical protein
MAGMFVVTLGLRSGNAARLTAEVA